MKKSSFFTNIKKCLKKDFKPNKDEFNNFSLFLKQIIGVICGITFGILGIQGLAGIIMFFSISCLSMYFYSKNVLIIDEDEIENYKIFSEGQFTGFIAFILSWILSYTYNFYG